MIKAALRLGVGILFNNYVLNIAQRTGMTPSSILIDERIVKYVCRFQLLTGNYKSNKIYNDSRK